MGEKSPGKVVVRSRSGVSRMVCSLLAFTPLLAVLGFYWHDTLLLEYEALFGYGQVDNHGLPAALMDQFRLYDTDGDGYIDPFEFSVLQQVLDQEGGLQLDDLNSTFEYIDEEIDIGKEVVVLEAEMEPIVTDTMTKFKKSEMNSFFGSAERVLPGLLQWKHVHVPSQLYGARNFRKFLPPGNNWPLGKSYYIVEDGHQFTPMNRYHPPQPPPGNSFLHAILAQLHPNVFLITRFGPKGTVGCVRARSDDLIDVVFRVHAEFQLNSLPDYPFWFTPGQFSGRLIANSNCSHIHHFELKLPTDNQLNIDMEWITGVGSNEVDIGYVPLMRVFTSSPSVPWEQQEYADSKDDDYSSIVWDQKISMEEAIQEIDQTFYPFKKVKYFSFLDAISHALQENKLIHLIILWGVLDDQSC